MFGYESELIAGFTIHIWKSLSLEVLEDKLTDVQLRKKIHYVLAMLMLALNGKSLLPVFFCNRHPFT